MDNTVKVAGIIFAMVAGFYSGVATRIYFMPRVVFQDSDTETVLGARARARVAEFLQLKVLQNSLNSVTALKEMKPPPGAKPPTDPQQALKQLAGVFTTLEKSTLKSQLRPETVFPDHCYRLKVANRGRGSARELRLTVRVPGVVVDDQLLVPAREPIKTRKILELGCIPVGVGLSTKEIPALAPGEEITLEVWYALKPMNSHLLPDWPDEVKTEVAYERGLAKRTEPGPADPLASALVGSLATSLSVMALVLVLQGIIRVRRITQMSSRGTIGPIAAPSVASDSGGSPDSVKDTRTDTAEGE